MPKYSPTLSLAGSQSRTAVTFAMRSPQPLAMSLCGALFSISISTKTPSGAVATIEYGLSPRRETNGLAIPSCDADVGTLTNGFFSLNATIFAISTDLPPPIPTIRSLLSFFISSRVLLVDLTSLLEQRCQTFFIFYLASDFDTFSYVIFLTWSPETKETFLGFASPCRKLPMSPMFFSPTTICLGSSMT